MRWRRMGVWAERVALAVLTVAAGVMAVVLTSRELRPRSRSTSTALAPPDSVTEWTESLVASARLGRTGASVQVVEFTDLECPFCRRSHETLRAVRARFGDSLGYNIVHFPLPMHRFARPAAVAAECAALQGRFEAFVHAVFEKQDSLGLRQWVSYAADAHVRDSQAFHRCTQERREFSRIEDGVRIGQRLGVTGTPTLFINGWRYRGLLPESTLVSIVDSILQKRKRAG